MSAETVLYSTLTSAPAVSSIVGTRVYPDAVPAEQPLPSVGFARGATEYERTIHDNAPILERETLEVVCMAQTRAVAEQLGDACLAALATADFLIQDRRTEWDSDNEFYAAVLTVEHVTT